MKKLFVLFFLMTSFLVSAQNKKINGYLYLKDSICMGENKPYKVEEICAKNVKIYLSINEYSEQKYIGRSNEAGIFNITISEEDFINYKYLVFSSSRTEMESIPLNTITNEIKLKLKKGNSNYSVGKPAIYLYPKEKTEVTIRLDFKGVLGTTFPLYNENWRVVAHPNGELENLKDNRKYNYLFWEGTYPFSNQHFDYKDGFVVKKDELVEFFIAKLSQIGMNSTEINDFIVYWLPQLQKNEFNLIHFWINDNIDNTSFLDVSPNPETKIIVYFEFKNVEKTFKIKEQVLPKFERKGFTLVEWGGCNLLNNKIE